MLFQVYGDTAIYQWIGWILVFCCLIGANELARRTKTGGVIAFLIVPAILTIYFITITWPPRWVPNGRSAIRPTCI